jgi:hypothetical protein
MEISNNQNVDLKDIRDYLLEEYPEYEIEIRKGPFFEYVIIKKSPFSGVAVRIKENKILAYKSVPSLIGRIFPFTIVSLISMSGDGLLEGIEWVLENKYAD